MYPEKNCIDSIEICLCGCHAYVGNKNFDEKVRLCQMRVKTIRIPEEMLLYGDPDDVNVECSICESKIKSYGLQKKTLTPAQEEA